MIFPKAQRSIDLRKYLGKSVNLILGGQENIEIIGRTENFYKVQTDTGLKGWLARYVVEGDS